MKNIFILSTNKSSVLYEGNLGKPVLITSASAKRNKPLHLYITSNEEPSNGDYCIDGDDIYGPFEEGDIAVDCFKKIVLTTDPTLIADGIQAIDDDSFQWIIDNPSCERIDIEEVYFHGGGYYKASELSEQSRERYKFMRDYKIIIPKEDSKQTIRVVCKQSKKL